MALAALVALACTASFGIFLLGTWLINGGLHRRATETKSRFAPGLIFSHAGLAVIGLITWITYLAWHAAPLGWSALVIFLGAATLGATMFGMWLRAGNSLLQAKHRKTTGKRARRPRHAAEDHLPPPAVISHGLLALTSVTLVILTVIETM